MIPILKYKKSGSFMTVLASSAPTSPGFCRACHIIGEQDSIRGNKWKSEIINIYMVHARHFSSVGPVVRNVGGAKCQPFLKRRNYY